MIARPSFAVRRFRARFAALVACSAMLAIVPAALAAQPTPPPSGAPSVSQYTEVIPTSGGGTAVGGKKKEEAGTVLPEKTRKAVRAQGGSDAGTLERITTSPRYGAPTPAPQQKASAKPRKNDPPKDEETPSEPEQPVSAEAASSTEDGSGGTPIIALVVAALLLGTAGAAALAFRRRNSLSQHRV